MWIRIVLLIVLGLSLTPAALKSAQFLFAELAGALAGSASGFWGAKHTRYAVHDGRLHYVPHTYAGIAISLLIIGRLVYRFAEWYALNGAPGTAAAASSGMAPEPMMRSPLTVGLVFVVVGYYVCYYAMVLWKSKRISPEDLEAISAPTTAPG
jgi:hypothetical protein